MKLVCNLWGYCEESFVGKDKQNFVIDTAEDGCLSYEMRWKVEQSGDGDRMVFCENMG